MTKSLQVRPAGKPLIMLTRHEVTQFDVAKLLEDYGNPSSTHDTHTLTVVISTEGTVAAEGLGAEFMSCS